MYLIVCNIEKNMFRLLTYVHACHSLHRSSIYTTKLYMSHSTSTVKICLTNDCLLISSEASVAVLLSRSNYTPGNTGSDIHLVKDEYGNFCRPGLVQCDIEISKWHRSRPTIVNPLILIMLRR